ncbi:hypothetical protein L0Y49_03860 [bacterium]|nr:hypothetical protein [bacterium]MCI0566368.1 hypothetical protein [bacterium]MCI0680076.1 hypothetical protein [bacterium]
MFLLFLFPFYAAAQDEGAAAAFFGPPKTPEAESGTTTNPGSRAGTSTPTRASVLPEKEQLPADVFEERPVDHFSVTGAFAFFVQSAARAGMPTETIALILLLPFLASIVAFVRNIVGLPSLDMLVPITFSIALVASSISAGILILATIILSSVAARMLLKYIRIMELPKIALSMVVVSLGVLFVLSAVSEWEILNVEEVSIVPILLLILLSERIVRLQFESALGQTTLIVATTLGIGAIGYVILASQAVRAYILLYPELIFLLVPINIAIGRYFGLRFTEYFRFSSINDHGDK